MKGTASSSVYVHQDPGRNPSSFFLGVPACYFTGEPLEETLLDTALALDAHLELQVKQGIAIIKLIIVHQHQNNKGCEGSIW